MTAVVPGDAFTARPNLVVDAEEVKIHGAVTEAYSVRFLLNGAEVKPTRPLRYSIALSELQASDLELMYRGTDGSMMAQPFLVVTGDTVSFETDKTGTWVFIQRNVETTESETMEETTETDPYPSESETIPSTSETEPSISETDVPTETTSRLEGIAGDSATYTWLRVIIAVLILGIIASLTMLLWPFIKNRWPGKRRRR